MEDKIDKCLDEQRILIGEREQFIGIIEEGNDELKRLETESNEFYRLHPYYSDDNSQSSVMFAIIFNVYNICNYQLRLYFFCFFTDDELWKIRKDRFKNY